MNILFLCDEYPPCQHGGIGSVTQLIARVLVNKGHIVHVAGFYPFYRKSEEIQDDNGVSVHRFFYGSRLQLQFAKRRLPGKFLNIHHRFSEYLDFLRKIIKENRIEIIESPDFVEAFRYSGPLIIQFPDFGIPRIVKLHGSYSILNPHANSNSVWTKIFNKEQIFLDSANGIIAVSDSIKQRVISVFKIKNNINVLYNGIKLKGEPAFNNNPSKNVVIFAGKLVDTKGIFSLLRAWIKVIDSVPNACLELYGKADPDTLKHVNSFIKDLPDSSVVLKGFISKDLLPEIYATASCAIFPSYQESFSMAPMEAMSVGCPVIYTQRTSGPELIVNNVDGLLIDPDNISGIADAIIFLLQNKERAKEIGQMGFEKIKSKFDISFIADEHLEYYKKIIRKYRAAIS